MSLEVPNDYDVVFHATPWSNVEAILEEGLSPGKTAPQDDQMAKLNTRYDKGRPDRIIELGVSRDSVYAHPNYEATKKLTNLSWLSKHKGRVAVLAVAVDPKSTYVADLFLAGEPYSAEEYWDSLVRLDEFRNQGPKPTFTVPTACGRWNQKFYYMIPEAIIPDEVEPNKISLIE